MKTQSLFAFLALALGAVHTAGQNAHAGPDTFVLREQLEQTYGPQTVTYPFTAANGECVPESIRVTGPNGPVAGQFVEIERWPKTDFVKSAKLMLLVDELKPLASSKFAVTVGKVPVSPSVATDLKIVIGDGQVELSTRDIGARLRIGDVTPKQPMAFKDVPGFLIASRLGANGAWAGGSAFTGDAKVSHWSSALTESGAVLGRVTMTCTFVDGNELTLSASVAADDTAVRWEMSVAKDSPTLGIKLRLPAVPGVKQALMPRGYGQWAKNDKTAPVTPVAPGGAPLAFLTPDSSLVNIFADSPWWITLAGDAGAQVQLVSRDPASWVDPAAPLTYGGFKTWNLTMIPLSWENWKRKRIPVTYETDGTVTLQPNLAKGQRKWLVASAAPRIGERLDVVKDMVLDWATDPKRPYPRVFVSQADIDAAWKRADADADLMQAMQAAQVMVAGNALKVLHKPADKRTKEEIAAAVDELRKLLAHYNGFGLKEGESIDAMRGAIATICYYDAVIGSDLITPQDQVLLKAQMAYFAYGLADPRTWNMERGFHSGNPNMTLSYTLSLGIAACAISDHPMAKTWTDYCSAWLDKTLSDEVGANGEWLPEGSHYGYVSLEPMVAYAVAAKRAGFRDFTNDERLKKCVLYFAKTHTPPDPQRHDQRRSGAFGRGTSGDHFYIFGTAAKMTAQSDPEFSKQMEWIYAASGFPRSTNDFRLGGYEDYYADRTLPQAAPAWTSDFFPQFATILRAGFNTPNESYLNFISSTDSERNLDIWTPGIGAISQWYGRGKPLSTCFNYAVGYAERHELLRDGVLLARNWGAPADAKIPFGQYTKTNFGTHAFSPTVDYVRSNFVNTKVDDRDWFPTGPFPTFPKVKPATGNALDWTRQLMFMKDTDPAGPAYIVLRDTTKGGQPTQWQFWTLSEKIGTPEQAADAAFLADKPGNAIANTRELPAGNRYTALGQFGVDVEYFIASPEGTPRNTLRAGGRTNDGVQEYEDLLHLQQPGDGEYAVVIYPRSHGEAPPTFSHAPGKVIKVTGAFGTDYVLLSSEPAVEQVDKMAFIGTAASVQIRPATTILALGAQGQIKWTDYHFESPIAATLTITKDAVTLKVPADSPAGEVSIVTNSKLQHRVEGGSAEVKSISKDGKFEYAIKLPATKTPVTVVLTK